MTPPDTMSTSSYQSSVNGRQLFKPFQGECPSDCFCNGRASNLGRRYSTPGRRPYEIPTNRRLQRARASFGGKGITINNYGSITNIVFPDTTGLSIELGNIKITSKVEQSFLHRPVTEMESLPNEVLEEVLQNMGWAELGKFRLAVLGNERLLAVASRMMFQRAAVVKMYPSLIHHHDLSSLPRLENKAVVRFGAADRMINNYMSKVLVWLAKSLNLKTLSVEDIPVGPYLGKILNNCRGIQTIQVSQQILEHSSDLPTLSQCTKVIVTTIPSFVSRWDLEMATGIFEATPNVIHLIVDPTHNSIVSYTSIDDDANPHWPLLSVIETDRESRDRALLLSSTERIPWIPLSSWIFETTRPITVISLFAVDLPDTDQLLLILQAHAPNLKILELSLNVNESALSLPIPSMPNLEVLTLTRCDVDYRWWGTFGFNLIFLDNHTLQTHMPKLRAFHFTRRQGTTSFRTISRLFQFSHDEIFPQISKLTVDTNDNQHYIQELATSFPLALINV